MFYNKAKAIIVKRSGIVFKFIKNWLDRLAKENEKSFGSGRLDCCDLNKPKNTQDVNNANKKP
ncbi:LDCC motif putative metal-binding protein [Sedimentibacter sp.]|uniref:LDCC motif putative metal-binding protein n=1 Tax=Sedimentibacter sp. TaxID=1960295 RepID=UPI0037D99301